MEYNVTGTTRLLCLLGSPVAHSKSPAMHNTAFQLLGLDYVYLAFDATEEAFPTIVKGLVAQNTPGFNITMPFKRAIIPYLDEVTPAARLCNSVNTVHNVDGRLIGYNTDGIGFMESIRVAGHDITGKHMTLLGAGGAASAICAQSALDGVASITMFELPDFMDNAKAFAASVAAETGADITVCDVTDKSLLAESIAKSAILVNATGVGMKEGDGSLAPKECLRPDLIVFDCIYHPPVTPLLRDAAEVGCPHYNGLNMLLYQGVAAFKIWTGQDMPVEEVKNRVFS